MDNLSGKLADQWVTSLLTPAFSFWIGGLLAWVWHFGWETLGKWFSEQIQSVQVTLLIGALLVVIASAVVAQQFDPIVLRFLGGFWPRWLKFLRRCLLQRQVLKYGKKEQRFQILANKDFKNLSSEELDEYTALDYDLLHAPALPSQLMPTKLGNILRAAELRPQDKYGLDVAICWPRLWLVLPEDSKQGMRSARLSLNTAARLWLWGILFCIWTIWAWWAIPIGLIVALFAYYQAMSAALAYSDLLDSIFDLHRTALYQSLRWPFPENPYDEHQMGKQITNYLWRGSDDTTPIFTSVSK